MMKHSLPKTVMEILNHEGFEKRRLFPPALTPSRWLRSLQPRALFSAM